MTKAPSSSSIFVGNVPYDAQEDELKEIFGKAGQVTSVRVVCDKDSKQPKGYAFCDFADSAAVQVAIEKLNNYEYNGRKLRVDGAERELQNVTRSIPNGLPAPTLKSVGGPTISDPYPLLTPVPTVADRMAQIREQEALEQARAAAAEAAERAEVARLMETLTPLQLLHIVGEMQRLTLSAPEVARALVGENAQLSLALQHAEFLIGLLEEPALPTDPEVKERARSVRELLWHGGDPNVPPTPSAAATAPSGVHGVPPSAGTPMQAFSAATPLQASFGVPTVLAPRGPMVLPNTISGGPQHGSAYAPTVGYAPGPLRPVVASSTISTGMSPMSLAPAAATGPGSVVAAMAAGTGAATSLGAVLSGANSDEQRRGLLERLVQLSPAQIDLLPHDQKVQLLEFLQTLPPA
eukprot:TRINITY_DN9445_c0_g1_i1.p1 TRINITY_DN9445_c0_g1~~TRINITY_DN9445_c0_g1_i1.p1  ORF type:complete len:408 (-),score=69.43 TRINITY_DN9445_c0_g1_i1:120-1343(-)